MTRKEAPMIRSLACLLGLTALASVAPTVASADSGSPNYRSKLVAVTPQTKGLVVRVVNGDDALELRNATGGNVMVPGYEGEPYLRFLKSGRVEVNVNSPARYLNEERYGGVIVPKSASAKSPPRWQLVADRGRYVWHEHRIHWMSTIEPPRVKASGGKTLMKVFDWNVPLKVGAERVKVKGTLWWVPSGQLEQADALIAAAVAKQARQAKAPPATQPPATTTEQTQPATTAGDAAAQAAPAAASEPGSSSSSSTALWLGLGAVALVLVAGGAYWLGRRGGDPDAPKGEVW
jgi:hypothetical protein